MKSLVIKLMLHSSFVSFKKTIIESLRILELQYLQVVRGFFTRHLFHYSGTFRITIK